jgi:hypothetical protein
MNPLALIPITISLGLLAACNAGTTPSQPAADTTAKRQPGSWQMLRYTMAFDATGVTGGMAEMVKAGEASVGKKEFGRPLCLSAALAAKDSLETRLREAIQFGPEWQIVRSVIKNGQVDFEATLDDPQQGNGRMTITGIAKPTMTDLLVTTDSYEPAPGKGHIRTVMKTENSRVGDCKPDQDAMN